STSTRGDPVDREYLLLVDKAIAEKLKGVRVKDEDGKEKPAKVPSNDTDVLRFSDEDTWTRQELRDWLAAEPSELDEFETRGDELRAQAVQIVEARKLKPSAPTAPVVEAVTSSAGIGLVKKKAA